MLERALPFKHSEIAANDPVEAIACCGYCGCWASSSHEAAPFRN